MYTDHVGYYVLVQGKDKRFRFISIIVAAFPKCLGAVIYQKKKVAIMRIQYTIYRIVSRREAKCRNMRLFRRLPFHRVKWTP